MKKNLTELVFIIDESGSMSGLESDTIGGFNSTLKKQKAEEGDAYVTTVFFSTTSKTVHDRLPLGRTPDLTQKDYYPSGCTALLDTVGETIGHIESIHKYARPEDIPENTIFVIITDGYENASRKYSYDAIKEKIESKKKENWDFIFLGANIDAVTTAGNLGISPSCASDYISDGAGTQVVYESMSSAITSKRRTGKVAVAWKKAVEQDFENRKPVKDKK